MKRLWILFRAFSSALCLSSLVSCTFFDCCRMWEFDEITTSHPCFNSGRMVLEPETPITYLEVELDYSSRGLAMYVNLLALQVLPDEDDPKRTTMEIEFNDGNTTVVHPYCLKGGQRLMMPPEVTYQLIETLLNDGSFIIKLGRQKSKVVSTNFTPLYMRLIQIPVK